MTRFDEEEQVSLFSYPLIVGVLDRAMKELLIELNGTLGEYGVNWIPEHGNLFQQQVLSTDLWRQAQTVLKLLKENEFFVKAARTAAEINAFLRLHGIHNIQLQDWDVPEDVGAQETFGIGAVVSTKAPLLWESMEEIYVPEHLGYALPSSHSPAFRLPVSKGVSFFTNRKNQTVVRFETQSDHVIYVVEGQYTTGMDLYAQAGYALSGLKRNTDYTAVVMPTFAIEDTPDVSDLIGLVGVDASQTVWRLEQAVMGGLATFSVAGYEFKMGMAAAVSRGGGNEPGPKDFPVDFNMLVVQTHKRSMFPIHVAYVGKGMVSKSIILGWDRKGNY